MGRYLIFLFEGCYPSGGGNDFIGSANTRQGITEVVEIAFKDGKGAEIVNILDSTTFETNSALIGCMHRELRALWKENLTELFDKLNIQ